MDSEGIVGYSPSLAVDADGNPHIGYRGITNSTVKYARWTGSAWDIQTVAGAGVDLLCDSYTSLALDANGNPHISYYDGDGDDLKYAHWTGSGWDIQTVDSEGKVGLFNSLALDAAGNPHISYLGQSDWGLKYAHWTGSAWDIQSIPEPGYLYHGISLKLDAAGRPNIGYRDFSPDQLKYAHWTGSTWDIQTVDSYGGRTGYTPCLALDALGRPHISYFESFACELRYAHWTGEDWRIEIVDSGLGYSSYDAFLALDATGTPHIGYTSSRNEYDMDYKVKYAQLRPIVISQQATPGTGLRISDTLTYTQTLSGPAVSVQFWNPLPHNVDYVSGSVTAPAVYSPTGRAIVWQGTLPSDTAQIFRFQVVPAISGTAILPPVIVNTAWLTDTHYGRTTFVNTIANGQRMYAPLVMRSF